LIIGKVNPSYYGALSDLGIIILEGSVNITGMNIPLSIIKYQGREYELRVVLTNRIFTTGKREFYSEKTSDWKGIELGVLFNNAQRIAGENKSEDNKYFLKDLKDFLRTEE
jgi:hypothetical protein